MMRSITFTLILILLYPFFQTSSAQNPIFTDAFMVGNSPMSNLNSVVCALPNGEKVLGTDFIDEATFGETTLLCGGGIDVAISKYSAENELLQLHHITGESDILIHEIIADSEETLYILGSYYGEITIGSFTLEAVGSQDIFLTAISNEGDVLWAKSIGGIKSDSPEAFAIAEDDQLIFGGNFYTEIAIHDTLLTSSTGQDIWIASYSAAGEYLTARTFGGTSADYLNSIVVTSNQETLIAAAWFENFTFGDSTFRTNYPTGVSYGQIDKGLNPEWMRQIDGSNLAYPVALNAGEDGSFFISGNFNDTVTFGATQFAIEAFNQDAYFAKFDEHGNNLWATHVGCSSMDGFISTTSDAYGNLIVAGVYQGELFLGPDFTLEYTLCCGIPEVYLAKIKTNGSVMWAKRFSGTYPRINAIRAASPRKIYTTGCFNETLYFDEITLTSATFKNYLATLEWEDATAVNDQSFETLHIFPNPSYGSITITVPESWEYAKIEIIDLLGRICFSEKLSSTIFHHNFEIKGSYLVRVSDAQNGVLTEKVVVR